MNRDQLIQLITEKLYENKRGEITASDIKEIFTAVIATSVVQDEFDSTLQDYQDVIDALVSTYVDTAKIYRDEAIAAAGTISSTYDDKGPYNALTNVPTLTASAPSSGSKLPLYNVTVAGAVQFAGYNFPSGSTLNIGDQLKSFSGSWYRQPYSDLALTGVTKIQNSLAIPKILENIVPNSEDFNAWTITNLTPTVSTTAGPEGLGYMWQLTEQAISGEHRLQSANISVTSGEVCTYSLYIKTGSRFRFFISLATSSIWGGVIPGVYVDLSTGILSPVSNVSEYGLDNVGNGIFRLWFKATAVASGATNARIHIRHDNISGFVYTGDITKFAYVGFPQVSKTAAPIAYIPTTSIIVSKSLGTYVSPVERSTWNGVVTQIPTISSSVAALNTNITEKLNLTSSSVSRIIQNPLYTYQAYTSQVGRKENRMWLFGKSTKRIAAIGVFIYKKASEGTISSDVRVQVLHQRNTTHTILADKTLPSGSLAAYNTATITDYKNHEVIFNLTTPITIQAGDVLMVSIGCEAGLNPIYSSVNLASPTGEWNNGVGLYYRYWTGTSATTYTQVQPYESRLDANTSVVHFYDVVTDYQRVTNIENQISAGLTQDQINATAITNVESKLGLASKMTPRIVQNPAYIYQAYYAQTRKENRMWFFGKSTKTINTVGIFAIKRASQGSITAPVRVQVLHQRGATFTVLLDKSEPAETFANNDDVETITNFTNYETRFRLANPVTLVAGDVICVSIGCDSGLNPLYATTNMEDVNGEWNNGEGLYYRYWQGNLPATYTSMPDYTIRADQNPGIVHFYEEQEDYQRIVDIETRLGGGSNPTAPILETLFPNKLYTLYSDITGYERIAASLYLDNVIRLTDRSKNNIRFSNNSDRMPVLPKLPPSGNVVSESLTFETKIGDWGVMSGSVSNITTKASILSSNYPKVMMIGDSQTVGTNANFDNGGTEDVYWMQMLEEFKKMNVRAGSGYSVKMLGSRVNYSKTFTYNSISQTVQGCAEAISGTSILSWLKHTSLTGAMRDGSQGAWDLLGLGNGTGTDWTASLAQRISYFSVCEGQLQPTLTGALYSFLGLGTPTAISNAINSTEQAAITAACLNKLNNPANWFFDKDKTGDTRFSLAKYLSRKKTLADDGTTRLVVGSTAGTLVSDVNTFDVCTPTHIVFRFLENEWNPFRPSNFAYVGAVFQQAIDAVHAEFPNIHVAVAPIGDLSTFFPDLYPQVKVPLRVASAWKYDFVKNIKSTVVDDKTLKSYFIPIYAVQPTAFGWNMLKYGNEMTDKPVQDTDRSYYWTSSDFDLYHPGGFAHYAWAYQFLSWIAYTYT